MELRNVAGAIGLCCVVSLLAGLDAASVDEVDSIGPLQICQSLCGACRCTGQLMGENVCHCSCDFPPDSAGGANCTANVKQLCTQMDVECNFNWPEMAIARASRGCHTMSCYEKHREHGEGHEEHYDDDEEGGGYDEGYGHGGKELICCKDKKHKEKKHKHKHKKHKKDKHRKFHIVIKGKMPELPCHHGEGGDYYEEHDQHDGYRAAPQDGQKQGPFGAHVPMDVSVWTNRRTGKKHPQRKPFHQQQQQHQEHHSPHAAPYPKPDARGKSAEPPLPAPQQEYRPDEQPPRDPPLPPPMKPEAPPVTARPEHHLTPPPNLYDGAPILPMERPQPPAPQPPKAPRPPPSFSRPALPPPPPMITVEPMRSEPARSYAEPDYFDCQFDSYDYNQFHTAPLYSPPRLPTPPPPPRPPPPPPSSPYRSYSLPYHPPTYSSSYYNPHSRGQYETPKHYSDYEDHVNYHEHDDSPIRDASEHHRHGVHALSDTELEDWTPPSERDPADVFTFNQIVSRQIWENERAFRYSTLPFQPTPRPLRDEFERPGPEVGPVLFDSFGSTERKYSSLNPPPDAFVPPVPPPASPVEFPRSDNGPVIFPANSEEIFYAQPTPPPHYLWIQDVGDMSSFGFESSFRDGHHRAPSGYARSRGGSQAGGQRWSGPSQHDMRLSSNRRF